jgi:hypothetical protein
MYRHPARQAYDLTLGQAYCNTCINPVITVNKTCPFYRFSPFGAVAVIDSDREIDYFFFILNGLDDGILGYSSDDFHNYNFLVNE